MDNAQAIENILGTVTNSMGMPTRINVSDKFMAKLCSEAKPPRLNYGYINGDIVTLFDGIPISRCHGNLNVISIVYEDPDID